jgi:predicted esterase
MYNVQLPVTEKAGRAWFYYNKENPSDYTSFMSRKTTEFIGLEDTLLQLRNLGEFDIVVGFSQGAHLARYVAPLVKAKRIVFISGFLNPQPSNACILESSSSSSLSSSSLPTLHIYGTNDTFITPEMSNLLVQQYSNATVVTHDHGHVVPGTAYIRNEIREFIKQ